MIDRQLIEAEAVAREHVIWARLQGMTPSGVLADIGANIDGPITWDRVTNLIAMRWIQMQTRQGAPQCAA